VNSSTKLLINADVSGRICSSEVVSEFGSHPNPKLSSRYAKDDNHSLDSRPHTNRSADDSHEAGSKHLDEAAESAYQSHVHRARTSVC
jgi:hypothetical protein